MPDIARLLGIHFCRSSFEDPIVDLDGWRLFMTGFMPAAGNTVLMGKILGWKSDTSPYYCSLVGVEDGAFVYQKGCVFPEMKICVVNAEILTMPQPEMLAFVRSEVNKALARLVKLLHENHGIADTVVEIPEYSMTNGDRCVCCGQAVAVEKE